MVSGPQREGPGITVLERFLWTTTFKIVKKKTKARFGLGKLTGNDIWETNGH